VVDNLVKNSNQTDLSKEATKDRSIWRTTSTRTVINLPNKPHHVTAISRIQQVYLTNAEHPVAATNQLEPIRQLQYYIHDCHLLLHSWKAEEDSA